MKKENYYIKNLKRLYPFVKKFKGLIVKAGIFFFIGIIIEIPIPLITKYLIDNVFVDKNYNLFIIVISVLIGAHLLIIVTNYIKSYLIINLKENVILDVDSKMYNHIQRLSLNFFKSTQTSYLTSRIREDTWAIQHLISYTMLNVLKDLLVFAAGIFLLALLHLKLAIFSISLMPFYVLSLKIFNKKIRNSQKEYQEQSAIVSGKIQESFSAIFYIKIFLRECFQLNKIIEELKIARRKGINASLYQIKADTLTVVISALGPILVLGYGGWEVMRGSLSIGGLVAFSGFLGYLYGPARRLMFINTELQRGFASLDRLFELLDLKVEEYEGINSKKIPNIPPKLLFENVSFSYDADEKLVLDTINLEITHNKIIALVGDSGVGKTTLVNLIPAFYKPNSGNIFINDINISSVSLMDLRKIIGIVGQEPFVFNDTILNNIKFGNIEANPDEIFESAKMANAYDFIKNKPEKFDTIIGERGAKLSIGEKQRIGIARCLLKKPLILILDEPTSSNDPESEKLIMESLKNMKEGRIIIVIAHRMSTIMNADEIFFLKGGKILEKGTHSELINKKNNYYDFFNSQFRE